jgi:hypothetical protein
MTAPIQMSLLGGDRGVNRDFVSRNQGGAAQALPHVRLYCSPIPNLPKMVEYLLLERYSCKVLCVRFKPFFFVSRAADGS